MTALRYDVDVHGYTVWGIGEDGRRYCHHETKGVSYNGMDYAWMHGMNHVFVLTSKTLTILGDLPSDEARSVFLKMADDFLDSAAEQVMEKVAESGKAHPTPASK